MVAGLEFFDSSIVSSSKRAARGVIGVLRARDDRIKSLLFDVECEEALSTSCEIQIS